MECISKYNIYMCTGQMVERQQSYRIFKRK